MKIFPSFLPYQRVLYHSALNKGKIMATFRNESAMLRERGKEHPLRIVVKKHAFELKEEFPSGGKGLTNLAGEIKALEKGSVVEVRIVLGSLLNMMANMWKFFLMLSLAVTISCLLLGLFFNAGFISYLWVSVPAFFFIYVLTFTIRQLIDRQVRRLRRVLEVLIEPNKVEYEK